MKKQYDYLSADSENKYLRYMYNILEVVRDNKGYFMSRPKQLAYVMWQYDKLSNKANDEEYWGNLKYPIIELEEELGKEYGEMVYDAWGASVSNNMEIQTYSKLECKENKTMEDYYKIKLDKNYRYKSIYPDKKSVDCHLLCTIGNGYEWNKAGYICEGTPSDNDATRFYNFQYTGKSIHKDIKKQISLLNDNDAIKEVEKSRQECIRAYKKHSLNNEWAKQDKKIKELLVDTILKTNKKFSKKELLNMDMEDLSDVILNNLSEEEQEKRKEAKEQLRLEKLKASSVYYPISEGYSLMCTMPENAHESYIKAAMKIALQILSNPEERESSKEVADAYVKKWRDNIPEFYNAYKDDMILLWADNEYMLNLLVK